MALPYANLSKHFAFWSAEAQNIFLKISFYLISTNIHHQYINASFACLPNAVIGMSQLYLRMPLAD